MFFFSLTGQFTNKPTSGLAKLGLVNSRNLVNLKAAGFYISRHLYTTSENYPNRMNMNSVQIV